VLTYVSIEEKCFITSSFRIQTYKTLFVVKLLTLKCKLHRFRAIEKKFTINEMAQFTTKRVCKFTPKSTSATSSNGIFAAATNSTYQTSKAGGMCH
jgi:hypothetical protein